MPIERQFYDVMRDAVYLGKPCKEIVSPRFATRDEARGWAEAHRNAGPTLYICETTAGSPSAGSLAWRKHSCSR